MWNNCTHYFHQISQPSTPKSPSPSSLSHENKTLSPRVRFPHLYQNNINLDPSPQFPQPASPRYGYYANHVCGSPVYAFPHRMVSPSPLGNSSSPKFQPSPRGMYPWPLNNSPSPKPQFSPGRAYPFHLNIGRRFGLVPGTPPGAAAKDQEEGQRWQPSTVELVGDLSGSCSRADSSNTRGIGPGPADEVKMERFKIRTVDIGGVVVQEDEHK
ncbi:hypothetical protein CDL15_Pgr003287 [Punica granatum]|uniref:Uncharacterized protein n=1 Tax=Punica granatum TaxID=22663 RepID=A0A218X320_PUNGR|nr:hypothetical protein CDL15_Pgr003287 [Punica granatum]PKI49237.1 hypothetical protein CRG98_030386 [Punica granatum]